MQTKAAVTENMKHNFSLQQTFHVNKSRSLMYIYRKELLNGGWLETPGYLEKALSFYNT